MIFQALEADRLCKTLGTVTAARGGMMSRETVSTMTTADGWATADAGMSLEVTARGGVVL